jgi:hypothetical protein
MCRSSVLVINCISRGAVSIVTGLQAGRTDSRNDQEMFSSSKPPDRNWTPLVLLFSWYREHLLVVKRSECDADNSLLSNTECKCYWDSNSTSPCAFMPCREKILTEYFLFICILRAAGVSKFAILRLDF